MFDFILHRIFGLFQPIEKALLDELAARLAPDARTLLVKQIGCVNKIQRHAKGREVNLYCMKSGKTFLQQSMRFLNASPEILLAKCKIQCFNLPKSLFLAEIWMSRGRVFCIIFNKSPARIGSVFTISDFQVLANPMEICVDSATKPSDDSYLLSLINAKLPDDYFKFINNTYDNGDWVFYNLARIHKIIRDDRDYYVFAEKDDYGVLAVADGDYSGAFFFLDYEDDSIAKINISMTRFLDAEK